MTRIHEDRQRGYDSRIFGDPQDVSEKRVWERVKWYLTIELTTFRTFRRHETTIEVMMLKNSKEGGIVTDLCQVGGHVECKRTIAMPNGGTQGVIQHFLRFHPAARTPSVLISTGPKAFPLRRSVEHDYVRTKQLARNEHGHILKTQSTDGSNIEAH